MRSKSPSPPILPALLAGLLLALVLVTSGSAAVSGAQLWSTRYNGPASRYDGSSAIATSRDGTKVFVTGQSNPGLKTGGDYATVAYNASTGAKLWVARYNGPGSLNDAPHSLVVSGDGTKVFVTGQSYGGSTTYDDYATIAYSALTGAKLWVARYNGPASSEDEAYSLAVNADGTKVFVTGQSTPYDYATIAYKASTGAKLWSARYNGPGDGGDWARSIAVSGDGKTVFVTGGSNGGVTTDVDYATIAYNASTGANLWTARYTGPGHEYDEARLLAVSGDGTKLFVTGHSYGGSSTKGDYATVAYNASTGAQLWSARYNGPGNGYDIAYSLAVSGDGTKVFVTGGSGGSAATGYDFATLAYKASTGAKLWSARYGPGNHDAAYSLAVSADGTKVFVTGGSWEDPLHDDDFATLAHNASTGATLWVARYNGPGSFSDVARAVAVSSDGTKVFVTGDSYGGSTTNWDYATVAYKP